MISNFLEIFQEINKEGFTSITLGERKEPIS